MLFFLLVLMAPFIYIYYRFLRTLRDLLRAVSDRNRTLQPELVWLNFIPVFSFAWMIVTVVAVRNSARAEFAYRGLRPDGDFGYAVGMTFAVISAVTEVYSPIERFTNESTIVALAVLSGLLGVASFVCWLVYWEWAAGLRDTLNVAVPVTGSPAAPVRVTYEPRSWEVPQETASPALTPAGPPGPWLSGQPAADPQGRRWLNGQAPAGPGDEPVSDDKRVN